MKHDVFNALPIREALVSLSGRRRLAPENGISSAVSPQAENQTGRANSSEKVKSNPCKQGLMASAHIKMYTIFKEKVILCQDL